MKFFSGVLLLVSIILLHSSCHKKCKEGCDTIYETEGAYLSINDTIVSLSRAETITTIAISGLVAKKNGDRDCKYENEISCMKDGLDTSRLSIFCNKDLFIEGKLIPMNTDLLSVTYLVQASSDPTQKLPFIVLKTTPSFPKGRYHFLLQGSTNDGKDVEDIAAVNWE